MSSVPSYILLSFVWAVPYLATLVVGIVLALVRWRRHPAVSALLVASLGSMLLVSVGYRVAAPLIVSSRGSSPVSSVAMVLGLLTLAIAVIRTACWGAMIVAILGWRTTAGGERPAPLQFSIRGLIVVTFAVAVLCAFGRVLVGLLGNTSPMLLQVVDDIPVVICLGIGTWMAAARWARHPRVSLLAIWAFAVATGATIVIQLLWIALTSVVPSPGMLTLVNFTSMLAAALGWALAIGAALGWRIAEPSSDRWPTIARPFES